MNKCFLLGTSLTLLLAGCTLDPGGDQAETTLDNLNASPQSVTVGQSVTYTWTASGDAADCTLDIGSDGIAEYTLPCADGTQQHTFDQTGTFTAMLEVTGQETSLVAPPVVVTDTPTPLPPEEPNDGVVWRPAQTPGYGVAEAQSIALNGKLYIFGAFDSTFRCCRPTARAFVFDPATETWASLKDLPPMNGTGHGGVTHAGTTTDGKDIYLASGYTSNAANKGQIFGTREVWRYNVASDSYTRLPDLPEPRAAGQLEYLGGKLYYFGGTNQPRTKDTGELYILDLAGGARQWSEGAPLPNPRNHIGSAVLGGEIYAIAGQYDHDGRLTTQADVHAYNPATNSWRRVADMPVAISHHSNSTFVKDGRIIVVGGEYGHLKGTDNIFSYDPGSDTWEKIGTLPTAMVDPVAQYVGGKLVVAAKWKPVTYIGTLD